MSQIEAWYDSPDSEGFFNAEMSLIQASLRNVFGYHSLLISPYQLFLSQLSLKNFAHGIQLKTKANDLCAGALECQINELPFIDSSLDAIILVHVVEWIDDVAELLAQLSETLRSGGSLFILIDEPWVSRAVLSVGDTRGYADYWFSKERLQPSINVCGLELQSVNQAIFGWPMLGAYRYKKNRFNQLLPGNVSLYHLKKTNHLVTPVTQKRMNKTVPISSAVRP